jgi:hypothetical protein
MQVSYRWQLQFAIYFGYSHPLTLARCFNSTKKKPGNTIRIFTQQAPVVSKSCLSCISIKTMLSGCTCWHENPPFIAKNACQKMYHPEPEPIAAYYSVFFPILRRPLRDFYFFSWEYNAIDMLHTSCIDTPRYLWTGKRRCRVIEALTGELSGM